MYITSLRCSFRNGFIVISTYNRNTHWYFDNLSKKKKLGNTDNQSTNLHGNLNGQCIHNNYNCDIHIVCSH